MKHSIIFIILASCMIFSSCSVTAPLAITDNPVGTRKGIASSTTFFGLGNVDVGIEKAAKNGKITKVATVDYKVSSFLFIIKFETIVTGTGPGDKGWDGPDAPAEGDGESESDSE